MISILIPVYNFEVTNLVKNLVEQAKACGVEYEILCFDDGSEEKYKKAHRGLADLEGVRYKEMPKNLGRSAIRNTLANAAKYPYLLFMDGDSKVVREDYVQHYIDTLEPGTLLYGGRIYDDEMPNDPSLHFHWQYGRQREQVPASERQQRPYHAFQTNNFLIPRLIFERIRFDESLKQYGHEDTLFGFELKRSAIPLVHIDNPLEHIGLESAETFLRKTEKGIENLLKLAQQYPFVETKLLNTYRWLNKFKGSTLLRVLFKYWKPKIEKRLLRGESDMRWFDIYKLGLMVEKAALPSTKKRK